MRAVKKVTLPVRLTGEEIRTAAARWHFGAQEMPRVELLYEAALPLIRAEAWFSLPSPGFPGDTGQLSAFLAVTLGEKIDLLQDLYSSVQAVSSAYMLECIGNALLEKCYGMAGDVLRQETGLFLNTFLFPGSDLPIEKTADIVRELAAGSEDFPIVCNEAFVLKPKKSVVFAGGLGEKKTDCGICGSCGKTDCAYRQTGYPETVRTENYNYGYRRIFGDTEKGERE